MNLKVNIAVNLGARAWSALMSFAFVPLYIRFIGIEGYGLIGAFAALLALFSLLDLGLSLTVNREIARRGSETEQRREARSILRTFETIYWAIGIVVGIALFLGAPLVAGRWINLQGLQPGEAILTIRLLAVAAVLRWPVALYLGALQGSRRQVRANLITSLGATLAGGGAVLALWLLAPRVEVYATWQILAFAIQIVALRIAAWKAVPLAGDRPGFSAPLLRASGRFSAGITGITLLSLVLTQLDKILLTRLLPLADFGYYVLATAIAGLFTTAGAAVETAVFPLLAAAVARSDKGEERELYHKASQGLAVLVFPAAVTLTLFSRELLEAYLGDAGIAARAHRLLALLTIGNACLAAMFLPLSLQLAHGWTKLSFYKNMVAVLVYVPLLLTLVPLIGAVGAAWAWLALTLGYVLLEVPVMHGRLLRGEAARWYLRDMAPPLLAALAVLGPLRLALPANAGPGATVAFIAAGGIVSMIGALATTAAGRDLLRRLLQERILRRAAG